MASKSVPRKAGAGVKKTAEKKAVAKGASVEVVVTVEEAHLGDIAAVARRLKSAGLSAPQTLKSAGIITGNVAEGSVGELNGVAGVKAVEASRSVQIAPPDADVQ